MRKKRVLRARGWRTLSLALLVGVLGALLALPLAARAAAPDPTVTSVSPTCGPLAGNTAVLVNGTGFMGPEVFTISLQVGGINYPLASGSATPLGGFRVLSANQLEFRTAGTASAGLRDVKVTTNGGDDTLVNGFDYNNACAAASVTVNAASGTAGVQMQITGSGFTGMTSVTIGGLSASPIFVSDTVITITPPALTGVQTLTVNTNHGSGSSTFTYGSGLVTVTNVNPSCGFANSSNVVTITGSGFVNNHTTVTFGGFAASIPNVWSSTLLTVTSPALSAGTVDVIVTVNGVGTSANTAADNFTFAVGGCSGAVSVSSVSPTCGANFTANLVNVYGTGFVGGQTTVTFGGFAGSSVVVNSANWLTVYTPTSLASTTVDVIVTVSGVGTSTNTTADNYTFGCSSGLVSVTSLSPTCGANLTATLVNVYGTGFVSGTTSVSFGGYAGTSVVVNSPNWLTVYSPTVLSNTTVDVLVTVSGVGTSANTSLDNYTFGQAACAGPVVTSINPASGSSSGGTSVTITGSGFTGATSVTFGGVAATFNFVSDSSITATSPAGTLGTTVDVRVITPLGTSPNTTADNFTYGTAAAPTVTGVSPSSGPIGGGTTVTITGTGFVSGSTTVTFGGTAGTNVTVASSTSLTVTAPAHTGGQFDVVVTTGNGSSTTSSLTKFTYTGGTISYTLSFRWTLIVWNGADGMTVGNAVSGNDGNSATNDLSAQITLIARWNAAQQRWDLSFPAQANVPGANDFTTLVKGTAYFVAIAGPNSQTWTVQQG